LSGENLFVNSKGYRECKTCRAHHARQRVLRLMVPCERCGAPCYPPSLRRTNTTVCRPCWFKGQSVEAAMKLGRRA
jgi:formylmethanofuran dehydrogenase subunit E